MSLTKHINTTFTKSFDAKTVDETRKIKFIISTGNKDRGGEVINMDNWNLKNFNENPIIGYQHDVYGGSMFSDPNPDMVIAKGNAFIDTFQGKNVVVSEAEFEPAAINPLAEKIFQKVKFGSLNSASVGIMPIGQGTYNKETKTYFYDGQELLEWSIVNIPMNSDARRMSMKRMMRQQIDEIFKGISISPELRTQLMSAIDASYPDQAYSAEIELTDGKTMATIELETIGADPELNKLMERVKKLKK